MIAYLNGTETSDDSDSCKRNNDSGNLFIAANHFYGHWNIITQHEKYSTFWSVFSWLNSMKKISHSSYGSPSI